MAKAELEDMGEDTDTMVSSTAKLRENIQGMTGFDIMADEAGTEFKDIYDIVIGIGKEWDKLSDINRAALLEQLAGKNQANALASALQNWQTIEKAYQTSVGASDVNGGVGSAMTELENAQQGIEYSLGRFKATFQEFAADLIDTSIVKGIVDFGSTTVGVFDTLIKKAGSLGTVITALAAAKGIGALTTEYKKLKAAADAGESVWTQLGDDIAAPLKALHATLGTAGSIGAIGAVAGIAAVIVRLKVMAEEADKAKKAMTASVSEYNTESGTLDSLNQELTETQNKILALQALENPSLVDQQELADLQQRNSELERAIQLQEQLVKTSAMQAASDAEDTLKKWTSDANFLWGRTENAFDPDKIAAARENYASGIPYIIGSPISDEEEVKNKIIYTDPKPFKDNINELIALYQACDEEIANTQAQMNATDVETDEGLNKYQDLTDYLAKVNKKMVETEGYISDYRGTLQDVWNAYDTEMNEGIYNRRHREQMAQIEEMLDAIGETVQKGQDLNSVQDAIDNIFNQSDFLETKNRLVEAAKEGREALTKELASIGESSPLGQAIKDAFIQDGELEDYFMNMIDPAKLNLDEVRKQLADFITGFDEDPITQQGRKQLYDSLIGTASDEQIQEFYNALVNRGELANIGSMSAEEFTRAFNETVTQQEPVSNGTFADLLTKDDSEVLQTVSSFREQMSGLSEVTNQLQSGEVTMSDVIEKFPELAGRTTTLSDSISDLKTENLLKFKSNWDELTKGLAGEELENANKQFTEFLKDVDMSGVKFDRAGKTILDALFPDVETSGAERKALVEAWNGAYDDVVKTTADEELLMKIIADPANAYKTKDEIIAAFESAKVTMDVETTWNGDMSGIDAYNAAKETANAGDKYLQMLSIAKEVQEMADKGLVGTDEFKAGAALFSPNAMGDVENWAENSGKVFRYLTEDKEGVTNLLKDMAQLTNENGTAMATWNEETGDYTLNIQDFEKSADALGISFDLLTASLARLGDYGGNLDFFASMEEGQDHLADLYGDLAKQEVKLQELKEAQAAGDKTVTDTVINEQQKRVDQIRQSIENTQSLLDVFIDKSAEKLEAETKSHAQSALSLIDSLGGMDTRTQQRALQALQTESDQYSLGLKFEVDENGMLSLVESSVQDLQDYVDGKPVKPKVEIEEPIEEATADENEVPITTDLDRSEYDSFVEEVEGTTLKAKIETVTGATGIEDKKHGHEVTQETAERRKKFAQPDGAIGINDKQHGHDVSQATAQAAKAHRQEYTKQWLGDITSDANEAINKVIWDARTNFNKTLKSRGDFIERSTWSNSDKIKGIIADINNDIAQKRAEALTVQNQKELDELLGGQKIESTEMENELYRRENPVRNAAEKTYDAVQESVASAVEKTGEGIANEQYVSRPDQTLVGFGAPGNKPSPQETSQETPLDPMLEAGMAMNEVLEQGALRATELYRAVNEGEVYSKVAQDARKAADEVNATNDAMAETERQVGTTAPEDTEYDPSEAMADEAEYVERINASRQDGIKNIKEEAQEVHGLLGLAQQLAAEEEARNQAAQTEAIYQPPNFYRKSFVPNKGIEAFVEDLRVAGKEAEDLSGVDLDFDVNTASIEELEGVISQLNAVKESLSSQGLENPGLEQFIFAMNNLRNFRLDVTAQTEPIDALKARIDEIASSDTTVDVVAEVQNDEQVQVLAEHLASLPTDIQTSIGISTENVGNVQGIISQATQNPQSISVPVEYTQGTIQSPEAQTTDVNYERGSQEPPKDEDATVSYTYGGQDPPHDATATVNYTMGAYETVLPPATQVVQRVYIDSGGGMRGGRAEGTAHAYAGGTLYGLWEEYRHSQNAYAFGSRKDWALPQDEEALVNELGTESIVFLMRHCTVMCK